MLNITDVRRLFRDRCRCVCMIDADGIVMTLTLQVVSVCDWCRRQKTIIGDGVMYDKCRRQARIYDRYRRQTSECMEG